MKECWDQKANIRKLKVDHKVKRFKSSANIILEEKLTNDVDANALFEVAITSLDKNSNPHWYVDSCASQHVTRNNDMVNKLH